MSLLSNFRKMVAGSALAQLITLASLPVISYLYEPSSLGYLASFMAIVSIIGMVSSMRLERGLFRLTDESEHQRLLGITISISIFTSLILTLATGLVITFTNIGILYTGLVPLYFTALSVSLIQVFSVYLSALGDFKKVAKSAVLRSLSLVVGQCITFYICEQKTALILSAAISSIVTLFYLFKELPLTTHFTQVNSFIIKRGNVYKMASGFLQSSISSVNNNANILLVSAFFGVSSAGVFMIAERLIRAPINLVSNNLRPVFAKHYQEKDNVNKAFNYSLILALLSLPLLVSAYFAVDIFIDTLFTDEYREAILFIKLLLVWVFFNFIQIPFQSYNLHFSTVHYSTVIELTTFISKGIVFYFFLSAEFGVVSICYAILTSSFLGMLLNVTFFYFLRKDKNQILTNATN